MVISQTTYAAAISIIEEQGQWSKIQLFDHSQGWVERKVLVHRWEPYLHTTCIVKIKIVCAFIYPKKSAFRSPPILKVPYGTRLEVLSPKSETARRWIKVRLLDGQEGFLGTANCHINPRLMTKDEMLFLSHKFLGIPFRGGGTSSFGFDCSGLIQVLFYQMGIVIPRKSKDQANFPDAAVIDVKDLKGGDLLFFAKKQGFIQVTHVGLYYGKTKFIHAVMSNKKGPHVVQISDFTDAEWRNRYITARRYV